MAHKFQNDEKIRSDVKKYEFWNSKATKLDAKFERIFTFYSSKTIVLQFFSHQTLISLFWKSLKQVWVFFCFRLFFNFFFVGGYEHMWTKLRLFISFLQYSSRDYFTRKFFERLNSFFMFFFWKNTHTLNSWVQSLKQKFFYVSFLAIVNAQICVYNSGFFSSKLVIFWCIVHHQFTDNFFFSLW